MEKSIKDILVVSDMDGILLDSSCKLPPCNLETIRLFTRLGGNFTVATARTVSSVEIYPQLAEIICPAIINGGSVLYDFAEGKPLRSAILPHLAARQALRDVMQKYPSVGGMVISADMSHYQVRPSVELYKLINTENMQFFHCPYENLPTAWNKVFFAAKPELLAEILDFLATRTYPGIYFIFNNNECLEIMPKGVSMASALEELCSLLGVSLRNTYAMGDYLNNADLLKKAGHAVAMENAPDEIKKLAHEIAPSNNEGGAGQFLYSLITKYDNAE